MSDKKAFFFTQTRNTHTHTHTHTYTQWRGKKILTQKHTTTSLKNHGEILRECKGVGPKSSLSMYILGLEPNSRTKGRPKRSEHCQWNPC